MASEARPSAAVLRRPAALSTERSAAGRGLWRDAWRRLCRNRAALAGLGFIVLVALCAVLADVLAPYPFWQQDLTVVRQPPSPQHWLGTDELGRDILSRLLYGARISLAVGLVVQALILLVGVPVGALAGYFGGWLDTLLMRAVDVLYSIPDLLLVIVVMTTVRAALAAGGGTLGAFAAVDAAFGGLLGVFVALALTSWLTVARLVRGQVLSLKEREFVDAARTLGAGDLRILRQHLLPNTLAPIIVAATFGIPSAILLEASLSFLGLGAPIGTPEWGALTAAGQTSLLNTWWLSIFPGTAIFVTALLLNMLGDTVQDLLDPGAAARL